MLWSFGLLTNIISRLHDALVLDVVLQPGQHDAGLAGVQLLRHLGAVRSPEHAVQVYRLRIL